MARPEYSFTKRGKKFFMQCVKQDANMHWAAGQAWEFRGANWDWHCVGLDNDNHLMSIIGGVSKTTVFQKWGGMSYWLVPAKRWLNLASPVLQTMIVVHHDAASSWIIEICSSYQLAVVAECWARCIGQSTADHHDHCDGKLTVFVDRLCCWHDIWHVGVWGGGFSQWCFF